MLYFWLPLKFSEASANIPFLEMYTNLYDYFLIFKLITKNVVIFAISFLNIPSPVRVAKTQRTVFNLQTSISKLCCFFNFLQLFYRVTKCIIMNFCGGGVGVKAYCLKKDLGLLVGCPPWGFF